MASTAVSRIIDSTAEIPLLWNRRSVGCERQAVDLALAAPNPDVLGHAFKVIVKLACFNLAGANPRRAHGSFGVVPVDEECVAAGMHPVADGDGPSVAVAVEVVCALSHTAFGNEGCFDGNGFHLEFPCCVKEESNGTSETPRKICGEEGHRTMAAQKYSSFLYIDILGQDFKAKMKSWLRHDSIYKKLPT